MPNQSVPTYAHNRDHQRVDPNATVNVCAARVGSLRVSANARVRSSVACRTIPVLPVVQAGGSSARKAGVKWGNASRGITRR